MNSYDEKIIAIEKKIKKLLDDIDKKKARVAELRLECKQLQSNKDKEYSEMFIRAIKEYPDGLEQADVSRLSELFTQLGSADRDSELCRLRAARRCAVSGRSGA